MNSDLKLPFIDGLAETNFPKERTENIEQLRAWLSFQPHLPELSDDYLHLFLHSCYDNVEKSKKTLENYFTLKAIAPEFFRDRNPFGDDVQQALDVFDIALLPNKTPEGYKVFFCQLKDPTLNKFVHVSIVKTFFMLTDLCLSEQGLDHGYIAIFDIKKFTLGHITRLSISVLSKLMFYIQDCAPIRLMSIRIINTVPFMDKLLVLLKPFMQAEFLQKFHIHGPVEAIKDIVPLEILPEEYGGKALPLEQLSADVRRRMEGRFVNWYQLEEQMKSDESKRINQSPITNSMFGVEGSFRKLNID